MKTDLRRYGYWDYEPLINKETQMMTYLDGKFNGIDVNVDTGAIADAVGETVKETLDSGLSSNQAEMDEKFERISRQIAHSTDVIIHTPRPRPAHPGSHPHHHHPHHCGAKPLDEEECYYTDLNMDVLLEKNEFRERASNW